MSAGRRLIVNADDFGQSPGINRGVIEAHERGIVTSASLMVRWPAALDAAAYARGHPSLGLGLHLDLGEWWYDGAEWREVYRVVDVEDAEAVREEVAAQIDGFRALTGRDPDHLDSHQHVHRRDPAHGAAVRAAAALGIPLREVTSGISYCGAFYGQGGQGEAYPEAITVDALVRLLRAVPVGTTEIGCHPGYDDGLTTMYRSEREVEIRALTDQRCRSTVGEADIELISFTTFGRHVERPRAGRGRT